MSGRSIGSRLQGLEEKLRREAPHRPNELGAAPVPAPAPAPASASRRPRLAMNGRSRPRNQLELASIPAPPVSQSSIETERKLREIYKMSGQLTIDGVKYSSNVSDLQHLGELGNGTCGHVVKMLHKPSASVIAVKQMRRSGNSEENKRILMDLEVVLRSHGCPYIVRCLGYFITDADVWICMELMASCFDKILKRLRGSVPEEILGKVTVATVNALSYLKEEHGVIHRDVKPSNILVDERGVIKLCDFGISGRLVDSKAKTRGAGCAAYMAPERINPPDPQKPDYDIRADVWSLGITLVELATGDYPYKDCTNDFEVLSKVIEEEPPALPESLSFSEEFKSFVKLCLIKDYRQRPKYAALLEQPFVVKATGSGACVGTWVSSALPPGSPRLSTSSFRHRHHINNYGGKNKEMSSTSLSQINNINLSSPHQTSIENSETLSSNNLEQSDNKNNFSVINNSENYVNTSISVNSNLESIDNKMFPIALPKSNSNAIEDTEVIDNVTPVNVTCSASEYLSKTVLNDSLNSRDVVSPREKNVEDNLDSLDKMNIKTNKSSISNHPINIDYYVEHSNIPHASYRNRSFSNTVNQNKNTERWPYRQTNSPSSQIHQTTRNYYSNSEIKMQPFSGGGGPSSLENYNNYNRHKDLNQSKLRSYGSPDINRKQYFSPCNSRLTSNYDHRNKESESSCDIGLPTNFIVSNDIRCENVDGSSPPTFRPNGSTNYFTAVTACTASKFPLHPTNRNRSNLIYSGNYHQNPGGSCSQPASLEAYDSGNSHPNYTRVPEKNFSSALWSPQLVPRWAIRDKEERERDSWRTTEIARQQQGNTSPIVLQRFFHQQGQRRSRRDWESSTRQSSISLNRDASVGRSPEPPRRAHRDPSLPRDHLAMQFTEHPLLREWREKERGTSHSYPLKVESNIPVLDNDRKPDILKSHNISDNGRNTYYFTPMCSSNREQIINDANTQFESKIKKSVYHHHMREKNLKEMNGDCCRNQICENPNNTTFEHAKLSKKDNRDARNSSNEKTRENEIVLSRNNQENTYYNAHVVHKPTKHRMKDKDDQGWLNSIAGLMKRRFTSYVKLHLSTNNHTGSSRSSSPGALSGCSAKGSRLTSLSRRVAACDYDDTAKLQDVPHNFVSDIRISGGPPQPPPRRTTNSWSLPGSPLPTRPI